MLTSTVDIKKLGTYTINYSVTDQSGNKATASRTVIVIDSLGSGGLSIALKGSSTVKVQLYSNYTDAGYTVTDKNYPTSKVNVTTITNLDITHAGIYDLRYEATDPGNNVAYSGYRYIQVTDSFSHFSDTTVCRGTCPDITAPASGSSYLWSTGAKTKTMNYCPTADNAVWVAVTSGINTTYYEVIVHLTKYACVWPGDANNDFTADKNDVLAIGIAYADSGAKRSSPTTKWVPQQCDDWGHSFKSGANHKHADCNGDGKVDSTDMAAVTKNYGKSHTKTNAANGSPTDPLLSVAFSNDSAQAGDTVKASIQLGTSTNKVKDAYGLAFSINYTSKYVKPGQIYTDFSKCWLGTPGKDLIYLVYNDTANGILDIGMSRTDHNNVTGYGTLANMNIVMQDNVGGKTWIDRKVYFNPTDVKIISADETPLSVYTQVDSTIVYQDKSGIKNAISNADNILLFPNPASQNLYLMSTNVPVSEVRIINMFGAEVYRQKTTGQVIQIPVSQLNAGIYSIQMNTSNGISIKQFIKK